MKHLRAIALLSLSLLAIHSKGGEVYWNTFTLTEASEHDGHYSSGLYTDDPIPDGGFHLGIPATLFNYGKHAGNSFKNDSSGPSVMDADWALVVFAEAGDTLDWNYFASASSAYDNHITRAGGQFATLTIPENTSASSVDYFEPFYMAMLYWFEDDNGVKPGYAWFELTATFDGLEMSQCATTLDEGLIVGTGQFAGDTPEPTTCLLLHLGVACLALRRRRLS